MKFATKNLIARIDTLIEQRTKDAEQNNADEIQKVADKRAEWMETNGEGYVLFANRVKDKIRKGRPITLEDVAESIAYRYGGLNFFSGHKPKKYTPNVDELLTLKATLEAVTDDEITTTGLREIGFKNVASLFGGAR